MNRRSWVSCGVISPSSTRPSQLLSLRLISDGTIRETVANDANAIGYLSHGLLNEKIKAVLVDGQACTNESITSGSYKLVRPIFLLVKGTPAKEIQDFVD